MTTEVRFATQADAREFYGGNDPIRTFNGVVGLEDGKPIALAGVYRDKMAFVAFTHFKVDPKKYKREIVEGAKIFMDQVLPRYPLVWAVIDEKSQGNDPASFIKRFGFKPHGGRNDVFYWSRNDTDN